MNAPPESSPVTVKYHTGTFGAKVGVVVCAKKNIGNTSVPGDYAEESAHLERGIRLDLEIFSKVKNKFFWRWAIWYLEIF